MRPALTVAGARGSGPRSLSQRRCHPGSDTKAAPRPPPPYNIARGDTVINRTGMIKLGKVTLITKKKLYICLLKQATNPYYIH